MRTRGCIPASSSSVFQDDNFATSSRGTPRKPLLIRFVMKQRQSDSCKTDQEEVPTRENASEEVTSLEESSCSSSFRGLPCWSVTGRRGRETKQPAAPTGRDNEVENAARILLPQMSPMATESTSEERANLDPRLEDNAAESDTLTDKNTNRMEVASSNGDVETSMYGAKGESIMIPEVNSTHNAAAELEAGHQNGNMATLNKKEEDRICGELEIYELTTLKLAVNISNKDVKWKGSMSPTSAVSEISTWSENPIQNVSELSATDDENENMACSSAKAVRTNKRKRGGLEINNTSEGNGSKEGGYVCNICNKSFSTYQALGGHKTFHTKQHKSMLADTSSGEDGHDKETKLPHQCRVCNKAFQTGQKLGGHMRAHFQGTLSSKRVKHNAQEYGSSSATAAREKSPDGSSSQSVNNIAPAAAAAAAASLSEDHTMKNNHTTAAAAAAASLSEDHTMKNNHTTAAAAAASSLASGSVMTEMVLRPHDFDLNELPREGDILAAAAASSPPPPSSDTPAADVMLDLSLSL